MARAEEQTAGLELSVVPGRGRPLPVTAELRNAGDRELQLVCGQVLLRLLDEHGAPVTEPGWVSAAGQELVLASGAVQVFRDVLALRGPRGGAHSVPLPSGRYRLQAELSVALVSRAGAVQNVTLLSTPVPLDLPADR